MYTDATARMRENAAFLLAKAVNAAKHLQPCALDAENFLF